jgi:hypothetical protein
MGLCKGALQGSNFAAGKQLVCSNRCEITPYAAWDPPSPTDLGRPLTAIEAPNQAETRSLGNCPVMSAGVPAFGVAEHDDRPRAHVQPGRAHDANFWSRSIGETKESRPVLLVNEPTCYDERGSGGLLHSPMDKKNGITSSSHPFSWRHAP